jgi:hypothetical protein
MPATCSPPSPNWFASRRPATSSRRPWTARRTPAPDLPYALAGAVDADLSAYQAAIALLENEADVDMVLVSVQDTSDTTRVGRIYADVISHCDRMSALSQGRIGFGEVPGNTPKASPPRPTSSPARWCPTASCWSPRPAWWARWPA